MSVSVGIGKFLEGAIRPEKYILCTTYMSDDDPTTDDGEQPRNELFLSHDVDQTDDGEQLGQEPSISFLLLNLKQRSAK